MEDGIEQTEEDLDKYTWATVDFKAWPKTSRLFREIIVTEKIDGTNSHILITPINKKYQDPNMLTYFYGPDASTWGVFAGSRSKFITPGKTTDNYGFAQWVVNNIEDVKKLGPGHHYGEWWGNGIQRNYGLKEKRFSLFNVTRWCLHNEEPREIQSEWATEKKYQDKLPPSIGLVPILYRGNFSTVQVELELRCLRDCGSKAAPGFYNPEGIVVYHTQSLHSYKVLIENDDKPKSNAS